MAVSADEGECRRVLPNVKIRCRCWCGVDV